MASQSKKTTKHPKYTKKEFLELDLGQKKAALVAWLMRKGVSLEKAKLICHRKFYHGDPYEG